MRKFRIEATADDDRRTLERHASDDMLAVVAARPELLQDDAFRGLLARARSFTPRGEANTARSALSTFGNPLIAEFNARYERVLAHRRFVRDLAAGR